MFRSGRCGPEELDSGQGLAKFVVVLSESRLELEAVVLHSWRRFGPLIGSVVAGI